MAPLESRALGTGLVHPDSLESEPFLLVAEELGGGDVRRQEKVDGDDRDESAE